MNATDYAAALEKFAADNKNTIEALCAQLNSGKGRLPGKFMPTKRGGAFQPEALVEIMYVEANGTTDGYQHCCNYNDRSTYGNTVANERTPSLLMVTRRGGGKSYKEHRTEGGLLTEKSVKAIVAQIRAKRTKYLKTVARSLEYLTAHPEADTHGMAAHDRKVLEMMGR